MLYLTDVDKDSAPFSVVPGSHKDGSRLRTRAIEKAANEYEKIKNWPLEDYPESGYSKDDIVPIEGKAGTLIIFDTDIFHLGGNVSNGKERMMIRSHVRG